MKKLLFLLVLAGSSKVVAMRQDKIVKKDYSKEDVITLNFDGVKHPKKVVIITPSIMSKGKAETYFRKNGKKVSAKMLDLIDITLKVLFAHDTVEYQEGLPARLNKNLYDIVAHPESAFIHKAETECIYVERPLGADKKGWHFTLLAEINACKVLPSGGLCAPFVVQMHHDKGNVHAKVWIAELRSFFAESTLPVIMTEAGERFVPATACADAKSFIQVKDYDAMLRTVAQFFIASRKEYKNLN